MEGAWLVNQGAWPPRGGPNGRDGVYEDRGRGGPAVAPVAKEAGGSVDGFSREEAWEGGRKR